MMTIPDDSYDIVVTFIVDNNAGPDYDKLVKEFSSPFRPDRSTEPPSTYSLTEEHLRVYTHKASSLYGIGLEGFIYALCNRQIPFCHSIDSAASRCNIYYIYGFLDASLNYILQIDVPGISIEIPWEKVEPPTTPIIDQSERYDIVRTLRLLKSA